VMGKWNLNMSVRRRNAPRARPRSSFLSSVASTSSSGKFYLCENAISVLVPNSKRRPSTRLSTATPTDLPRSRIRYPEQMPFFASAWMSVWMTELLLDHGTRIGCCRGWTSRSDVRRTCHDSLFGLLDIWILFICSREDGWFAVYSGGLGLWKRHLPRTLGLLINRRDWSCTQNDTYPPWRQHWNRTCLTSQPAKPTTPGNHQHAGNTHDSRTRTGLCLSVITAWTVTDLPFSTVVTRRPRVPLLSSKRSISWATGGGTMEESTLILVQWAYICMACRGMSLKSRTGF